MASLWCYGCAWPPASSRPYPQMLPVPQLNYIFTASSALLLVLLAGLAILKGRKACVERRQRREEEEEREREQRQRRQQHQRRGGTSGGGGQSSGSSRSIRDAPRGFCADEIPALGSMLKFEGAKGPLAPPGPQVEDEEEGRQRECIVCLCDYEDGEMLRVLNACGHDFHKECVDAWLLAHKSCPLCRTDLTPATEDTPLAHRVDATRFVVDSDIHHAEANGAQPVSPPLSEARPA